MKRLLVIGFLIFLASCSQSNVQSNMLINGEQEVTVMFGTNYVDLGVVAIEGTVVTDALDFYYNMNITEILYYLWNGRISPEEAQRRIVQNSTN